MEAKEYWPDHSTGHRLLKAYPNNVARISNSKVLSRLFG